jgi:hypothetical protein
MASIHSIYAVLNRTKPMAHCDNDSDNAPSGKAPDATRPYEDVNDDAPLVAIPENTLTYEDDDDDAPLVKQLVNPHDMQSDDVNVPVMKQPVSADLLDFDSPPPKVP